MGGNLTLIVIITLIWLNSFQSVGQSDTTKTRKIKFDWELAPPGAGFNFSLNSNNANSFGIGISILNPTIAIAPVEVARDDVLYSIDLIYWKFFYRNRINKRIAMEYSLKHGFSNLVYGPNTDLFTQLLGFQFAISLGVRKVKYKPSISVVRSLEIPTTFVYVMPLVFNFNL
ncbi:MAG: hypothetical protein R2764_16055 [Bacteroidales bacterium]